jgi:DNA-binding NarL/FixJ family response regulator
MNTRIVLVSSDPLAGSALRGVLAAGGAEVVSEHRPDAFVPELLRYDDADLVVWDCGSDPEIPPRHEGVPIVVLVPDDRAGQEARARGHLAIVPRLAESNVLAHAIEGALLGLAVIDPRYLPPVAGPRQLDEGLAPLSDREIEVLELVALGMSNKEIAAELGISESTVKFHLNAILLKLDAGTRTEAAVRATQLGWLEV